MGRDPERRLNTDPAR